MARVVMVSRAHCTALVTTLVTLYCDYGDLPPACGQDSDHSCCHEGALLRILRPLLTHAAVSHGMAEILLPGDIDYIFSSLF